MLHRALPNERRQGDCISLPSGQSPFWRNEMLPSHKPAQRAPLGHEQVPSLRVAQVESEQNGHRFLSWISNFYPGSLEPGGPDCTWVEGGGWRTANQLKSNQLQSTQGRGTAELFPQSPHKKTDEPKTQTQSYIQKKREEIIYVSAASHLLATGINLLMYAWSQSPTLTNN